MPQSLKSEERKMNNPDRNMSHSTGFRLFIIITLLLSCLTLSSCKLISLRPSVGNDDSAIGGTTDDESSDVTDGENTVGEALYFYAPALSQGIWINANRTYHKTIGCHRFYL